MPHEQAIRLVSRWIHWMGRDDNGPSAAFRVGIHEGQLQIVRVFVPGGRAQHGGEQIVGAAPNLCQRIASLGDGGDILLSEEFCRKWAEHDGASSVTLAPPLDQPPISATVKHGTTLQVRRIARKGSPPRYFAEANAVSHHLGEAMAHTERAFVGLVQQVNDALTPATVSARVSLWVPDPRPGKNQLEPTDFRYHRRGERIQPSTTRYATLRRGKGPVGRAFKSNKPQLVLHLPPYDTDQNRRDYENQLSSRTGLNKSTVRNCFSRHARAFVSIPVGLEGKVPDAVVCIDTDHPLTGITDAQCLKIATHLRAAFGVRIAALWRLRRK
jgi:hypothetical protein